MQFFDKIYILNLKKRKDRFLKMKKRLAFVEINNYEFFQAVDGEIMVSIFNMISPKVLKYLLFFFFFKIYEKRYANY